MSEQQIINPIMSPIQADELWDAMMGVDRERETEAIVEHSVIEGKKKFASGETKIYTQLTLDIPELEGIDYNKETSNIEELYNIARMFFDEENIHTAENRLFIRFPKLEMTNSKGHKHTIYDMIVRLTITKRESSGCTINFDGFRASMTLKELQNGYRHSHLHTGIANCGKFTTFCLGSSDFAIMKQNVQLHPTISNWMLLLMSIENYLSWESVEGGPYTYISGLTNGPGSNNITNTDIYNESKRLCSILPEVCIDVNQMCIIDGETFDMLINSMSTLRKLSTEGWSGGDKERLNSSMMANGRAIRWRDGQLDFRVIDDSVKETEQITTVDPYIKSQHIININKLLTEFKTVYQHEQYKKASPRAYYSLGETKADRNKGITGPNRLSTPPNRSH